ncbi:hypothetical protein PENSPDRAFT_434475 [Peniophora sp. CONT]|nr:hypothetical protein PENSPDRAFT_434475 [Peniophora sp. CONT]
MWSELRILNAVLRKICDDDYQASKPDIPRERYVAIKNWFPDRHNNERLETVGDSILLACLTLRLYEYEDATPMMMTKLRCVLLSNMVLALVAEKSDEKLPAAHQTCSLLSEVHELLQRDKRGEQVKVKLPKSRFKPTADRYEALAAELHLTHGLDAARRWFNATFDPLIRAGMESSRPRAPSAVGDHDSASPQKGKKRKLADAASSKSAKRMRVEGEQAPSTSARKGKGKAKEPAFIPDDAVIIDLTVDDLPDDELDEEVDEDEESDEDEHTIIDLTADDSDEDDDLSDPTNT